VAAHQRYCGLCGEKKQRRGYGRERLVVGQKDMCRMQEAEVVRRSVLRLYRIIFLKITTHVYELGICKQIASATRKMLLTRFLSSDAGYQVNQ
jgi:hypothetical protein